MRNFRCDYSIRYENTQRIQSERTLRSCSLVSAGRSKHANTRLGTRTRLYIVPILDTRQKIGTRHTPNPIHLLSYPFILSLYYPIHLLSYLTIFFWAHFVEVLIPINPFPTSISLYTVEILAHIGLIGSLIGLIGSLICSLISSKRVLISLDGWTSQYFPIFFSICLEFPQGCSDIHSFSFSYHMVIGMPWNFLWTSALNTSACTSTLHLGLHFPSHNNSISPLPTPTVQHYRLSI